MRKTAFEEFVDDNDNVALFGIGVLNKLRQHLGYDDPDEDPAPICFRARWSAIEQKRGGRDITKPFGEGASVPTLDIQYVVDNIYDHNHVGVIPPLDDALNLHDEEIVHIERLASSYDTEIIVLG